MIARENLEKRRDAMLVRSGALALERIEHEKRLIAIDEEARQIGVLLKVFDATLADLGVDEAEADKTEAQLTTARETIDKLRAQREERERRVDEEAGDEPT